MAQNEAFLTPVGRLVQGGLEPNTKNMNNEPLTDSAGNPRSEYYFGIAVDKTHPEVGEVFSKLIVEAQSGFPELFDVAGNCNHPTFAWKFTDGDLPKHAGREGFPGHWVFNVKSGFAPSVHDATGNKIINPVGRLKRGDYVRAHVSVRQNDNKFNKPGLYFNIHSLQVIAPGEEILSGPDGTAAYQAAPATAPQGAKLGTSAPAPGTPPAPGAPATPLPPGPATAPVTPLPVAPVPAPGATPLPVAPAPPPPAAPDPQFLHGPQYTLTEAATSTLEQYHEAGWTNEMLIQQGLLTQV